MAFVNSDIGILVGVPKPEGFILGRGNEEVRIGKEGNAGYGSRMTAVNVLTWRKAGRNGDITTLCRLLLLTLNVRLSFMNL